MIVGASRLGPADGGRLQQGVRVRESDVAVVDVVFSLEGSSLPAEHAYDLWRETVRWLPWLRDEAQAGIHPLRTAPTGYGMVLLARRAKLALRVPQRRLADALLLTGKTLAVGEAGLVVGAGTERPLRPWATLHSQRVVIGAGGEAGFEDDVASALATMDIRCEFITGRRRTLTAGGRSIVGFSVVLHGLRPDDSVRMQCDGVGGERSLGCGIFIPHKSIAAV